MSVQLMLDAVKARGSRTQYLNACTYWAHGNTWGVSRIYNKVIGS